jgi:putative toxin-antitoxin system antitoxin component (TIGR02293 family)
MIQEPEMLMPYPDEVMDELGLQTPGAKGLTPLDLFARIESGLPVAALERLTRRICPGDSRFKYQIVPKATLSRRQARPRPRLSAEESAKLVRLARIWTQARRVWGDEDAASRFLLAPHMLLLGKRPIDVALGNEVGAEIVEGILGRLQYGTAA